MQSSIKKHVEDFYYKTHKAKPTDLTGISYHRDNGELVEATVEEMIPRLCKNPDDIPFSFIMFPNKLT